MKTNKEIKPFKMLLSKSEYDKIIPFMLNRGICWSGYFGVDISEQPVYDDVMAITLEEDFEMMRYSEICDLYYRDCLPELTYSEFMKLYGDEEEVFTRDDMIEFAYGALCSLSHSSTEEDVEHLLTAYLSTRTND